MGGITLEDMTGAGALLEGHFKLSSGRHSSRYLQCALYLAEPARAEAAGRQLAARLKNAAAQVVVAPALGGVIIGHEVARALVDVPFYFTERADGEMVLRRGFAVEPGSRVLVVEDVVTTGGSTREVMDVVSGQGGVVVGVAAIVNRSGQENPFAPLPFTALLTVDVPTWAPEACPLCASGVPLAKPGSRPDAVSR
ncbi:MAG: orotate phosphoribosyltransferase [Thermoanaerobaculaceae bacterium]|nr:orotate phosphoribosyltransferase [Thermoanaerobaculaceae bacterium]TAM56646.1 MAG: orotate phosphoribosyltransferase [Acidobacteriota bacterium]